MTSWMPTTLFGALALAVGASALDAQAPRRRPARDAVAVSAATRDSLDRVRAIAQLDRAIQQARIDLDTVALGPLLCDGFEAVPTAGPTLSRERYVAMARTGQLAYWFLPFPDSSRVTILADDSTATVTGRYVMQDSLGYHPRRGPAWVTRAYVRRDGRWCHASSRLRL